MYTNGNAILRRVLHARWQTQEEHLLSDTTIRTIMRTHGQIIRRVEQMDVAALLQRNDLALLDVQLVPHDLPRCWAGWPKALNAAVEVAITAAQCARPTAFHGLTGTAW